MLASSLLHYVHVPAATSCTDDFGYYATMDGFEQVTQSILLRNAAELATEKPAEISTPRNPGLIVVCSWVAAHPKHIAKYTKTLEQDFPNASVLLVQTTLKDVVFAPSDKAQQQRIKPAADIVNNSTSSILFHVFSNGGAVTLSQILWAMTENRRAAIQAIIFDSCPGRAAYRRTVQAVITSAPKYLRPILPGVVYPALLPPAVLGKMGVENVISRARTRLNDTSIANPETPRVYLYSKADGMVWWQDARDHAVEARGAGYQNVQEVIFDNSAHCAHIQEDSDKYWTAIKNILGARALVMESANL